MAEGIVRTRDGSTAWSWPVRWEPGARLAAVDGRRPEVLLDDPRLAAHRALDRLGALGLEVHRGEPGASDAFVDAIRELTRAAPWLGRATDSPDADSEDRGAQSIATGSVLTALDDGMIDDAGVGALLAVATGLAGRDGGAVVLGLAAAAMAAEQWVPGLARLGDPGRLADVALLGGAPVVAAQERLPLGEPGEPSGGQPRWERGHRVEPELMDPRPLWARLPRANHAVRSRLGCLRLLHDLLDTAAPAPVPDGPVTWTTGITSVEVANPCGPSPSLTIHGQGFGAAPQPGVGVVAASLDPATAFIVYRRVSVVSWSDTRVVVQLGSNAASGTVAFADVGFIAIYDQWAKNENERVVSALHAHGCPGYGPPAKPQIFEPWSEWPDPVPIATYQAGAPRIVAELAPVGRPTALWSAGSVHLEPGEAFRVGWRTVNADTAALRASGAGQQVLVAAGHPATGVVGGSGNVLLVAPSGPAVVELAVEASNAACGTVQAPLRVVVTGPAVKPATITVLQSLPGGNVQVVTGGGGEMLTPAGRSIPLVAEKRSVARIDWWPAVPQAPVGEELTAHALVEVSGPATWPWSVTLRPGPSTADPPPAGSVHLESGPPFTSALQYEQWLQQAGNTPATFNVVLPAELCVGEVTLEATVLARSPSGLPRTVTATTTVTFHKRRRVRIRYRRHGNPGEPAPTTAAAEAALRGAGSLLPIPDPEILVLGNDPAAPSTGYIEDMLAERQQGGIAPAAWRDEIWLVVGPARAAPPGVGGYAPPWAPWTAATAAWATVTAHEIGHLFGQPHLNLCGAPGDDPTSFPDNGNVVVIGWDTWNNVPVQGAIDLMSYCWGQEWMSPERWRRIFLAVGP